MMSRVLLAVIVLACVCDVFAQVGSICRPKERLLMCGCPKTCKDPAPSCAGVCRAGCYCEEGEVRNDKGDCVKLADCPPIKSAYYQDTTEPRPNHGKCPINEEYRFCEPCTKTCDNPNPICPAQCSRGCFCINGLLRNDKGVCVKPEECQKPSTHPPVHMTCGPHQVYKQCETCEKTCSNPNPKCPTLCVTGCFCEQGFVKSPNGKCVKLDDCPKAETIIGDIRTFPLSEMSIAPISTTVEDCRSDEEFFSCGWCEPTCSDPEPSCPHKTCTTGCLCRTPLLRHHSGKCLEKKDCFTKQCKNFNEEYTCRHGCEPRCGSRRFCPLSSRRCVFGCFCKPGLLRDVVTKQCVTEEQCSHSNETIVSVKTGSVFNYTDLD